VRYPGSGVWFAKIFLKNYFFKETCAIMASVRGFGFKNRKLGGFFPGKKSQKPFLTAVHKAAA
jgi:hypothetical protein